VPLQDTEKQDGTNARLDTVIKLLAAMFSRELNNNDAIIKLGKMQLSREQIAEAVGVTTHNVAQVLYASKRADGKKKSKKAETTAPPDGKADAVAGELEVQQQ
jgi:hypothetical protein